MKEKFARKNEISKCIRLIKFNVFDEKMNECVN